MRKPLHFLFIFFLALNIVGAADQAQNPAKTVKHAKVILKTGEEFTAKSIVIGETEIQVISGTAGALDSYPLADIERIETLRRNFLLEGSLIGVGAGLASMLIFEAIYEQPKTDFSSGSWGWEKTTTYRTMSVLQRVIIVSGSLSVGVLLGLLIKRGGDTIYPGQQKNFDINFSLSLSPLSEITPVLTINYWF